jgi:plastocyanin
LSHRTLAAVLAAAAAAALTPSAASAATFTAFAGADGASPNPPAQFSPNGFFRRSLTIHVGDSVRWQFRGFHTVTFPARGQRAPDLLSVDPSAPVSGVNDGAGRPFWFNGQPSFGLNLQVAAPQGGTTVTGSKLVNSGLPTATPPKPFTARFTRAGTFTYVCAIHPGMRGTVRVVSPRRAIPTSRANDAVRTAEIASVARHARTTAAKAAPAPTATGATVQVGRAPTGERFTINAFFPSNPTVRVGQTVAFTMAGQNSTEVHTVTFGPTPAVRHIPFVGPTGVNAQAVYPSDPPTGPLPPYDGTNHGNGFLNSGVLDNIGASPLPNVARVAFSKAGTYAFECVVHENMVGTVTVTP